jgi:hypothetical protein
MMGMSRGWLLRIWTGFHDLSTFPKVDEGKPQTTLVCACCGGGRGRKMG